jgi:hypothetical protein
MWPKGEGASHAEQAEPNAGGELLGWRQVELLRAGFDSEEASRLAADRAIDLNELIGLVERGCPPAVAKRIVWPLERAQLPC